MSAERNCRELEFELAVTGVLEDVYDLRVRSARDPLNRRSRGYAVLDFAYQYGAGEKDVKVVVGLEGTKDASYVMRADLSSSERIAESAEQCEELAFAVGGHLDDPADLEDSFDRRWDEY